MWDNPAEGWKCDLFGRSDPQLPTVSRRPIAALESLGTYQYPSMLTCCSGAGCKRWRTDIHHMWLSPMQSERGCSSKLTPSPRLSAPATSSDAHGWVMLRQRSPMLSFAAAAAAAGRRFFFGCAAAPLAGLRGLMLPDDLRVPPPSARQQMSQVDAAIACVLTKLSGKTKKSVSPLWNLNTLDSDPYSTFPENTARVKWGEEGADFHAPTHGQIVC